MLESVPFFLLFINLLHCPDLNVCPTMLGDELGHRRMVSKLYRCTEYNNEDNCILKLILCIVKLYFVKQFQWTC